jgi:hypothetical protein
METELKAKSRQGAGRDTDAAGEAGEPPANKPAKAKAKAKKKQ